MRSAFICQECRARLYSTLPIAESLFPLARRAVVSQVRSIKLLPAPAIAATAASQPPPALPLRSTFRYGAEHALPSSSPLRRPAQHFENPQSKPGTERASLTSGQIGGTTDPFAALADRQSTLVATQRHLGPGTLDGAHHITTPRSWPNLTPTHASEKAVVTLKGPPNRSDAEASLYITTIWFLLKTLLRLDGNDGGSSTAHLVEQRELCTVWRQVFLAFGPESAPPIDSANVLKYDWNIWKHSPVRSFFTAGIKDAEDATHGVFRVSQVLPLLPEQFREPYFAALVATFSYMVMQPLYCTQGVYSPFLWSLAIILRRTDTIRYVAVIYEQASMSARSRSRLKSVIQDMEGHITIVLACHESFKTHDSRRDALGQWHVRLLRRLSQRKEYELFDKWLIHSLRHFRLLDSHWDTDRTVLYDSHERPFPRTLCREFIRFASEGKKPNLAMQTWSTFVDRGFKPSSADWAVFIDGAKHTGRAEAIEEVWNLLCDSGAEPGVEAWTARIHAVMEVGQIYLGMKLLQEMTTQWADASKSLCPSQPIKYTSDLPMAPKPSIWTINAVMKVLAGRRDKRSVHDVLNMAWSLGLKPDIYTLNIALGMYCEQGDIAGALDTIQNFTMADTQLELNMVSFTTLINGVLRFRNPAPGVNDGFESRVDYVMELIEKRALSLDDAFFSALLNAVARKRDFKAATAVMQHAHRHLGLAACVHTSTVFLKHAFREAFRRPELEPGIVQLALKLAIQIGRQGDSIFWNQLVIGLAQLGRLEFMARFLAQLRSHGQAASWLALSKALEAALAARDAPVLEIVLKEAQHAAARDGSARALDAEDTKAREGFVRLFQETERFLIEGSDT